MTRTALSLAGPFWLAHGASVAADFGLTWDRQPAGTVLTCVTSSPEICDSISRIEMERGYVPISMTWSIGLSENRTEGEETQLGYAKNSWLRPLVSTMSELQCYSQGEKARISRIMLYSPLYPLPSTTKRSS